MEIKSNLEIEIFKKIGTRSDIRIDEISKNADLDKITKNNGRSEFIVKTNTDKLVSVSSKAFSANAGNIKVGDKIKFSDNIEVEVVKKDKEMSTSGRILSSAAVGLVGFAVSTGLAQSITNPKVAAGVAIGGLVVSAAAGGLILFHKKFNDTSELDKVTLKTINLKAPAEAFESKSKPQGVQAAIPVQTTANKTSIYGANVSVDNARQWLTNNPDHARNPKLLAIADYEADGSISAENLSQAANAGTVVLNGVKSFYIPGETISEADKAQIEYHKAAKQNLDAAKAKRNAEAIGVAVGLAALLGGAVVDEVNRNLR